jgi:SCP-2 sterol transfer family protein
MAATRIQTAIARRVRERVGAARRERLERAMAAPLRRRVVLGAIFWAMPRAVRRSALERESVVIGWRVGGRPGGGHDARQLEIADGGAAVLRGEPREADLELAMDGVTLLLVATGNGSPATLFVRGQITVDGDPWLAMRLGRIFGRD